MVTDGMLGSESGWQRMGEVNGKAGNPAVLPLSPALGPTPTLH